MIHELRATAGGNTGAESVRSPQTGPAGDPAGLCEARVRCYAELNDHLPERWHQRDMPVRFAPPLTLAELLAALGLSTDAVELALIDGSSVDLDASVPDGARVSLYPAFEAFDIGPIQRLQLQRMAAPFTRCTCCNALIEPVDAAELRDVPQRVGKRQERFWRCPGCERIYWEGSHHRRMRAFVDGLLRD
jgi:hypothetical protein